MKVHRFPYDPEAMANVKQIGDRVKYGENQYDVLEKADALSLLLNE
jgi:hypothetical protein